jgi:5'-AMP-activated protein kinase, regulatory gamma subunit
MQAAPLWDPVQCQFVGLLTVTDFIDILRHYRSSGKDVSNLAVSSITDICTDAVQAGQVPPRKFRGADCTCTLKQACHQLMAEQGQDFLPIVFADDMRVLACITYTNILEHLVTHFREQRRLFDDSVTDLRIGTYGSDLVTVSPQQTLAEALESMYEHSLSALPVIDPVSRKVLGVYSRSDITFLTKATDAEDAVRNLDLPLSEILAQSRQDVTTPDALRTCSPSHTLQAIFESFAHVRFHRLFIVDQEDRLLGVVSAKDLVAYFLKED